MLLLLTGYEDARAAVAAHFTRAEAPLVAKVSSYHFGLLPGNEVI